MTNGLTQQLSVHEMQYGETIRQKMERLLVNAPNQTNNDGNSAAATEGR